MNRLTIEQLKRFRESEDKVEFKKAEQGNFAYDGGSRVKPSERRRCILGYVTALCNEGGGHLVLGMKDAYPHEVVGTKQSEGHIGELESDIYRDTQIRPVIYEIYEDSNYFYLILELCKGGELDDRIIKKIPFLSRIAYTDWTNKIDKYSKVIVFDSIFNLPLAYYLKRSKIDTYIYSWNNNVLILKEDTSAGEILDFINSDYSSIPSHIIDKYDISNWIDYFA